MGKNIPFIKPPKRTLRELLKLLKPDFNEVNHIGVIFSAICFLVIIGILVMKIITRDSTLVLVVFKQHNVYWWFYVLRLALSGVLYFGVESFFFFLLEEKVHSRFFSNGIVEVLLEYLIAIPGFSLLLSYMLFSQSFLVQVILCCVFIVFFGVMSLEFAGIDNKVIDGIVCVFIIAFLIITVIDAVYVFFDCKIIPEIADIYWFPFVGCSNEGL